MTPAEVHQLNAYLDGELDAAGVEAFEILLLQRPDLAEQVDADTLLGLAFKEYARTLPNEPIAVAAAPTMPTLPSALPRRSRRSWLSLATAASAILIVGIAGGRYSAMRSGDDSNGVSVAYVDQLRGVTTAPEVAVPETGSLILMAPVASAQPCLATLSLDQSGNQIASAQSQSDALGYAGLRVDAEAVHEGNAMIGVACAGQAPMRYPVTLRRHVSQGATASGALHRS